MLTGDTLSLMMMNGTSQFYTGFNTATMGYNGNYLGPTLVLQKGHHVTMNMMNMIGDTTTVHWHGLHVAPMNDGGPHTPILADSTWSPDFVVSNNAATCWYHPHLHHKTMSQVLKGAAGFIIVRDSAENALALPRTYGTDDFPLVFQFETFDTTTKQIRIDDEQDNALLVNGALKGMLDVPAQIVRFRLLNASSHRFFQFGMSDNRTFQQIATDAGLLNAPVSLKQLQLGPGERAEILIDFSGQQGSTYNLMQYGSKLPSGYPGGPPDAMGMMKLGPLDNKDFGVLQFNVVAPTASPITAIPSALGNSVPPPSAGATVRTVAITGKTAMSMTDFLINGKTYDPMVMDFTTQQGNVEVWKITNQSMMPHPFHIHGNWFFVTKLNGATPPANLQGPKDVITVAPMAGSVELVIRYDDFADSVMPYMYHCHILSHEDKGMMRQFIVKAPTTGITNGVTGNAFVQVYPNPATDRLCIAAKLPAPAPISSSNYMQPSGNGMMCHRSATEDTNIYLKVFDVYGKVVASECMPFQSETKQTLDCAAWAMGVYIVQLTCGNTQQRVKFLKQ